MQEIATESHYQQAQSMLSAQERAPAFLCALMSLFEKYRAARKIGWSRPWNKYGLTVFRSFKLDQEDDLTLIKKARDIFFDSFAASAQQERAFVSDLTGDKSLMGYFFEHDFEDGPRRYEGFTISAGRVSPRHPRHRDRFDLIFESEVIEGRSEGLTRLRVFVDPFEKDRKEPTYQGSLESPLPSSAARLFREALETSKDWAEGGKPVWDHWTQRFVPYFGERASVPESSIFLR